MYLLQQRGRYLYIYIPIIGMGGTVRGATNGPRGTDFSTVDGPGDRIFHRGSSGVTALGGGGGGDQFLCDS